MTIFGCVSGLFEEGLSVEDAAARACLHATAVEGILVPLEERMRRRRTIHPGSTVGTSGEWTGGDAGGALGVWMERGSVMVCVDDALINEVHP
jgi:hypothetical protein